QHQDAVGCRHLQVDFGCFGFFPGRFHIPNSFPNRNEFLTVYHNRMHLSIMNWKIGGYYIKNNIEIRNRKKKTFALFVFMGTDDGDIRTMVGFRCNFVVFPRKVLLFGYRNDII
ncbi:MAG: hypothetical protein ACI3XM_01555, partial [Eubacteriales bacterium]